MIFVYYFLFPVAVKFMTTIFLEWTFKNMQLDSIVLEILMLLVGINERDIAGGSKD